MTSKDQQVVNSGKQRVTSKKRGRKCNRQKGRENKELAISAGVGDRKGLKKARENKEHITCPVNLVRFSCFQLNSNHKWKPPGYTNAPVHKHRRS